MLTLYLMTGVVAELRASHASWPLGSRSAGREVSFSGMYDSSVDPTFGLTEYISWSMDDYCSRSGPEERC